MELKELKRKMEHRLIHKQRIPHCKWAKWWANLLYSSMCHHSKWITGLFSHLHWIRLVISLKWLGDNLPIQIQFTFQLDLKALFSMKSRIFSHLGQAPSQTCPTPQAKLGNLVAATRNLAAVFTGPQSYGKTIFFRISWANGDGFVMAASTLRTRIASSSSTSTGPSQISRSFFVCRGWLQTWFVGQEGKSDVRL